MFEFESTFSYKLIYVFKIDDINHAGCVKIGEATLHTNKSFDQFEPGCSELNAAAKNRINQYTSTAAVEYTLLYTEIAAYFDSYKNKVVSFRDYKVHNVLERSGVQKRHFNIDGKPNEWFECDKDTAIKAIHAVKEGRSALPGHDVTNVVSPIIFRPEQKAAISKTIEAFKTDNKMLWNAKMRFGKTLCALEVAKEKSFKKTIIITHRPVVKDSWYEDFQKIFFEENSPYRFSSKDRGEHIEDLLDEEKTPNPYFVYFASMQDLRGSEIVGGNFDKNKEIFDTEWDFVVVDEAHEGISTDLGEAVLNKIIKQTDTHKTYVLDLSGTPFGLLSKFEENSIYTWDYVMEQDAKTKWDIEHFGDSNPYESLPEMHIYTYHLERTLPSYLDIDDKAFNFKEFFRTWTGNIEKDKEHMPNSAQVGEFVHEKDVQSFLNLICKSDDKTNYPFATEEYRNNFKHTLWVVPGVKEAAALSALLKKHYIFKYFEIINVAGPGDYEIDTSNALEEVRNGINNPQGRNSITISCGRLTTGVTVPEWTAVLMLSGSYSTSAGQYMQTIFRVQTPANIDGRMKENCYVFDFAPDRTLKMVAEAVYASSGAGNSNKPEITLGKFLNYCPVISIDETCMRKYNVDLMMQQLKKAYVDRVARNGFDDVKLYNDELLNLTDVEFNEFNELREIVGTKQISSRLDPIPMNEEGFSNEEWEQIEQISKKTARQRTAEEQELLNRLNEARKRKQKAITILRSISIRIPLMIYGIDKNIEEEITIDNFTSLVDDKSWQEFMPNGVTKIIFNKFKKYYDKDVFIGAGKRIRDTARNADELEPMERVRKIASLFATFKNPDKETVLTPWRVVNLQLSKTIGGYDFFNESHTDELPETDEPRLVDNEAFRNIFQKKDSRVLEINSKTGLYPLYVAYAFYTERIKEVNPEERTLEKEREIWDDVVANNIFVLCKTNMAKTITQRTLLGYRYRDGSILNSHVFDDLVMQAQSKKQKLVEKIKKPSFWGIVGGANMKFNAVVGNPPYQEITSTRESRSNGQPISKSVFQYFQLVADEVCNGYTSLIYPGGRWLHRSGKGMEDFGLKQINDLRLKQVDFFPNAQDIFTSVAIADGISIVFKDMRKHTDGFTYTYHVGTEEQTIQMKAPGETLIVLNPYDSTVCDKALNFATEYNLPFLDQRISPRNLFGIESNFVEENKELVRSMPESENDIDFSKEIKLLTNDRAGKAGRARWFVAPREVIQTNKEFIGKWQVVVSSANAGGQKRDNQISIVDNHSAFGRSRVALGSFDTEREAKNFFRYMNTYIVRFMFLMTDEALTSLGKKVPDLIDYTDNNPLVTFDDTLDNQLINLLGLSENEIKHIKDKINNLRK